ncbi:MAG: hypothetical protein CV045_08300, partial [Cyanobacteria bacterium M5B4]
MEWVFLRKTHSSQLFYLEDLVMTIASVQDLFRAAWSDAEFKQKFLANPTATLSQAGVTIPEG